MRKRNTKAISLVMVIALLLIILAGCNSGPTEIEEVRSENSALDTTAYDNSDSDDATSTTDDGNDEVEVEAISFDNQALEIETVSFNVQPNSGEVELGEGFVRSADGGYAFGGAGGGGDFYIPNFNVDARTAALVEENLSSGSTYVPYSLHGDIAGFNEWADIYGVDLSDQESVRAYNNKEIALIEETTGAKINEQTTLNLVNTSLTKIHNSITAEATNNTTGHAAVFQAVMMYPYSCNSDANIPMIQGWNQPSELVMPVAYWIFNDGGAFSADYRDTGRYYETIYVPTIGQGFYMTNQHKVNVLILNHLEPDEQAMADGDIKMEYVAIVDMDGTVGYAVFGRQGDTWHCAAIYSMGSVNAE